MRLSHFIVFCFLPVFSFGQTTFKKKNDGLIFNEDSTLVLFHKGKKMGLFDVEKGEYVFKKTKEPLLPLWNRNWFVKIGKKGIIVYEQGSNQFKDGAEYLDLISGFSIQRLNETRYLLTDYTKNQFDSSGIMQLGAQNSGIYDVTIKDWIIPNQYKELHELGDFWLCKRDDSLVIKNLDDEYYNPQQLFYGSYDIYQEKQGSISLVEAGITENQQAYDILLKDELWEQHENLLTIKSRDGFGVIELDLFAKSSNGYPRFEVDTIIDPLHQFVQVAQDGSAMVILDQQKKVHFLEWNEELAGFDENVAAADYQLFRKSVYDEWQHIDEQPDYDYTLGGEVYSLGLYPDVHGNVVVINEMIFYPYQETDEYGESVFDWETGDPIYQDNGEAFPKSAVFSIHKNDWIIAPTYSNCKVLPNGYITQHYTNNSMQGHEGRFDVEWHIFDEKGKLQSTFEDPFFWQEEGVYHFIAGDDLQEVNLPKEMQSNKKYPTHTQLYQDANHMSLVYLTGDYFHPFQQLEADFIYTSFPRKTIVTFNSQTDWTFDFNEKIFNMEHPITADFVIKSPLGGECYEVYKIENQDTIRISEKVIEQCDKNRAYSTLSVTKLSNQDVLINDVYRTENEIYSQWGDALDYFEEDERSAVWRKDSIKGWMQMTPYYAQLNKAGNVFLAKTAAYSGDFVFDDQYGEERVDENGNFILEGKRNSEYLVLDSAYHAIAFLDHYDFNKIEDIGFGLSLTTDKGKMFVTYQGVLLTTDEWDGFQLIGNQIKAYKTVDIPYKVYEEPALDKHFEVLIPRPFNEAYFDLPQER